VKFDDVPASGNATVNGCSLPLFGTPQKKPLPAQIKINIRCSVLVLLPPICRRNSETGVSTRYVPAVGRTRGRAVKF